MQELVRLELLQIVQPLVQGFLKFCSADHRHHVSSADTFLMCPIILALASFCLGCASRVMETMTQIFIFVSILCFLHLHANWLNLLLCVGMGSSRTCLAFLWLPGNEMVQMLILTSYATPESSYFFLRWGGLLYAIVLFTVFHSSIEVVAV